MLAMIALCLPGVASGSAAQRCASAAGAFLDTLDENQRGPAARPFDETERKAWAYVTGSRTRKQGLALAEMSDEQRVLAHRLLACGLSSQGYQKAAGVMRLDDLVRANIGQIVFKPTGPIEIGKEFYWLAIFGQPRGSEPWSWQLEGHHLGLNFTVVDDSISVTPAFMGADPSEVRTGPLAGWRLLRGEEEKAFALLGSLSEDQLKQAVLADEVPQGLFSGPGRSNALTDFAGLAAAQMDAQQRQLLWLLIGEYVQNMRPEMADQIVAEILQYGSERLYFAWMGPTSEGQAIYYRIHSPAILIEFDHASNIRSPKLEPDPNHVHSIMRIPGADFGDDLLRRHYSESAEHSGGR